MRAREESHCALGTGIATPATSASTHRPRAPRERVCVCPCVHVYPSAHEALALTPAHRELRAHGDGRARLARGRARGRGWGRGAPRIRLLLSGLGWGTPAAGGLQSIESSAGRLAQWWRVPPPPPFARRTCQRPPAPAPPRPARHLSSERNCKPPRLASWKTPKGTRGLARARGKQGGFIPIPFGGDLEPNSQTRGHSPAPSHSSSGHRASLGAPPAPGHPGSAI